MRVAVLDDYQRRAEQFADWGSLGPDAAVSFFHEPIDRSALPATLAEFEVVVLMRERTAFPKQVLEQLPKLELLVTTGMRNASVDVDYLRDRGVVVCGTGLSGGAPAPGVPSTVEVAWALIFATFKRVTIEDRALRAGVWQLDLPRNLAGATLGLAGLGRLDPLSRDVETASHLVAQRSVALRRLTGNLSKLATELGDNESALTAFVKGNEGVFRSLAHQDQNLRRTIALLPPALRATNTALSAAGADRRFVG